MTSIVKLLLLYHRLTLGSMQVILHIVNHGGGFVPHTRLDSRQAKDSEFAFQPELDAHTNNLSNPHQTTKAQVGLGNVDDTSDLNKPVSTATQTALAAKMDTNNPVITGTAYLGTGGYPCLMMGRQGIPIIPGTSPITQWNDETGANSDWVFNVASNGYPVCNLVSSGGTLENPSDSTGAYNYGSILFWGYAGGYRQIAEISALKAGPIYNGSCPSRLIFNTTPSGSMTPVTRMTIEADGTITGVTKGMVGLGNVDNTSDLNKPVSTATLAAIHPIAFTQSNTPISTTATSSLYSSEYVAITTPVMTAGTYKINVNLTWAGSKQNTTHTFEIRVDDVVIKSFQAFNQKADLTASLELSGFAFLITSVDSAHKVSINWYVSSGTSKIQGAALEIVRIA